MNLFDVMDRNLGHSLGTLSWTLSWDTLLDTFWDTLLDIFWDTFWNISRDQTMQYLQQTPIDTPDVTKSLSPASPMITKAPHQHTQCYQKLFVGTPTGDKNYPSAPPMLFSIDPARYTHDKLCTTKRKYSFGQAVSNSCLPQDRTAIC